LGLQVFEQRTNLLTYSEQFDDASWSKQQTGTGLSPVVTANTDLAPTGEMTADTIVFNTVGSDGADTSRISKTFASVVSFLYTFTVFVKAKRTADIGKSIQIRHVAASAYTNIVLTADYQPVRITETALSTTTALLIIRARGDLSSGEIQVVMFGAQLEAGAFPTPYIKTEATTATRNASAAVINDIDESEWWNASEGTFVVNTVGVLQSSGVIFELNNGTALESLLVRFNAGVITVFFVSGGAIVDQVNIGSYASLNAENKVVVKITESGLSGSVNDSAFVNYPISTNLDLFTQIKLGTNFNNTATRFIDGYIKQLIYTPSAGA
jgi:hypothetical protein